LLDVVDSWKKPIRPDWFAMPTPPRTSGFPCSRLSLHCSRACATETRSAHPRSLRQDHRHAWSHLLRCFCSALTPLAFNLLARGLLSCTRTRLRNRAESATANTSARIHERASSIPLGPPGFATPPPSPPVATPLGPANHRRRSYSARRTRAALLLP
jgi:hypothetical protein